MYLFFKHGRQKCKNGFTLVELLVAVGIVGLLSAIAVMSISSVRARARDTKRIQDLKALSTALDSYANEFPNLQFEDCTQGRRLFLCRLLPDAAPLPIKLETIKDPIKNTSPCHQQSDKACEYAVANNVLTPGSYEICFRLETDQPSFGKAGIYSLKTGGLIERSCSYIVQ